MFLYLNAYQWESVVKYWTEFFKDLFTNSYTSQQKVLSLLRLAKNPKSKDVQEIANKILARLGKELHFNYYESEVLKQGVKSDINWKNNIGDIQGSYNSFELLVKMGDTANDNTCF